jgi:hypothetical protein
MSSGGKLAPSIHGVNQFFAANEALAIAAPDTPASANEATWRNAMERADVWTSKRICVRISGTQPQTRMDTGLHAPRMVRLHAFAAQARRMEIERRGAEQA